MCVEKVPLKLKKSIRQSIATAFSILRRMNERKATVLIQRMQLDHFINFYQNLSWSTFRSGRKNIKQEY